MFNVTRLIFTFFSLVVVTHLHVVDLSGFSGRKQSAFSIGVVIVLVLVVQLCIAIFGLAWPFLFTKTSWGNLMARYSAALDKMDVARGRSVPVPKILPLKKVPRSK